MKNKDSKEPQLPKEEEGMPDSVAHVNSEDDEYMDTDDQDIDEDDDESFSTSQPPLSQFGRYMKEMKIMSSGLVPSSGSSIPSGQLKVAGNYLLGPILGSSPVRSMVQCLGRKKNSDEFYTLKILTVKDASEETQDDKQGKMLLHTEHSLLSFLNGQPGIIREHGLFEDYACDGVYNQDSRSLVSNGKVVRRLCLALDCVIPHSFGSTSFDYINLQHYVIGKRKLKELDALVIFYNIVYVVKNLHDLNVIHRDLKLANLVLDKRNRQITLTNFCLGQHLVSADDKLLDQRGSPAYISPDVLSGKPYLGKPSDMWALGVVLYTMLYGQFPFYHKHHQELFKLIKAVQYTIPNDGGVKSDTLEIIQSLLSLDPLKRTTADQVLTKLTSVIAKRLTPETIASHNAQVVPDIDDDDEEEEDLDSNKRKYSSMEDDEEMNPYERDSYNILEILEASEPEPDPSLDKKLVCPIPIRFSMNYCFTTVPKEIVDQNKKKKKTISIIEGDLRTFTQSDLYTHRSIFPQFSGPDLFGSWRNPASGSHPSPPSQSPTPKRVAAGNARSASVSPGVANMRTPLPSTSASSSSSTRVAIPPLPILSCNAPHLYEFPPPRRWALAVLQQIHNNPNSKPPVVPQMEFHVPEMSPLFKSKPSASSAFEIPSSSATISECSSSSGGSSDNQIVSSLQRSNDRSNSVPNRASTSVDDSQPSCSGIGKKVPFSEDVQKNLTSDAEQPGPSHRPSNSASGSASTSSKKMKTDNISLRKVKNRKDSKVLSKNYKKLQLETSNESETNGIDLRRPRSDSCSSNDTIINDNFGVSENNVNYGLNDTISSGYCSSSVNSNNYNSNDISSTSSSVSGSYSLASSGIGVRGSSNVLILNLSQRNVDSQPTSSYSNPNSSVTSSSYDIGFLNVDESILSTDDNNNYNDLNNNNDDNNNNDTENNNNFNVVDNNNVDTDMTEN